MTFDEWLSRTVPLDPAQQLVAKCAWEAATKAEREACAKVCEVAGVARIATLHDWTRIVGDELATAIRERSNEQSSGAA
jgi:hypothetical protein